MEIYEKHNQNNSDNMPKPLVSVKTKCWAAVFLWFGLGVLLSGTVGFLLPYIINFFAPFATDPEGFAKAQIAAIVISALALFPLLIVFQIGAMKNKPVLTTVCYVLYSTAFGIMLSSLLIFAGAEVSLYALIVTGGIMAIMGVAGILLKNKLNRLAMIGSSLLFGGLIISLINFFFFNELNYWIASTMMLIAVLLIVTVDVGRINITINSTGYMTTSMFIYCAFMLYTDFIYIFIRVLTLLAVFRRRS